MRAFLGVDFLDALTDLAQEGLLDFALDDPGRHGVELVDQVGRYDGRADVVRRIDNFLKI